MAVDSHIQWGLASGQRVLNGISLKHRRSSKLSEDESTFPRIRVSCWNKGLCGRPISLLRRAKGFTNAEKFKEKFFEFIHLFVHTVCTLSMCACVYAHTHPQTHTHTIHTFCL